MRNCQRFDLERLKVELWAGRCLLAFSLGKIIHRRRKSLFDEVPDAVDDQLRFDPHPHAAQAADPTGQARQPAPEDR